MHELGLVIGAVRIVERGAKRHRIKKIKKLTLDIGESIGVIPEMLDSVYQKTVVGTILEGSELEVNYPGRGGMLRLLCGV